MVVKERPSLESLRERLAGYLRALAERLAPDSSRTATLLDGAPDDDEPLTAEDETAAEEGLRQHRNGEARALEEVKRELG